MVPKRLAQREHNCVARGYRAHRDLNAAENIRELGELQLPREPGKVTPAETGSYGASRPVPVEEAGMSEQ
ncbi:MAG: hypothetical protein HYT80_01525 [Euryarchaeota archaeon]|nr:hypothetical protein [Euryarchaeota archaeon]